MDGPCDPASRGDTVNTDQLAYAQNAAYPHGQVIVTIEWDWDGVKLTEPDCDGPLVSLHVWSAPDVTAWLHFKGKRGQPRVVAVPPNLDRTYNPQQLRQIGLETRADMDNFVIRDSPTIPAG